MIKLPRFPGTCLIKRIGHGKTRKNILQILLTKINLTLIVMYKHVFTMFFFVVVVQCQLSFTEW